MFNLSGAHCVHLTKIVLHFLHHFIIALDNDVYLMGFDCFCVLCKFDLLKILCNLFM